MFTRKKKKADNPNRTSPVQFACSWLLAIQRKWANRMQAKTRHWQPRQQKCFLFIICLVMGSFSTLSFLQLFKHTPKVVSSGGIIAPQPLLPIIHLPPEPPMPAVDTIVFRRFRKYLDSLLLTPKGKTKYAQFLKERPGFMDSLAYAEKMLQQSFPHYKK